jgi:heme-degrading monooxygenase HmoA
MYGAASYPNQRVLPVLGMCLGASLREVARHSYEADRQEENMFTSIRRYKVRGGSAEELARRVQEGFVPLIRQMQGFRSYYLLDGGPDVLITISRFDSADEAFASNEKAADWVRNNVLEFTKGMPEVMVGYTLIA